MSSGTQKMTENAQKVQACVSSKKNYSERRSEQPEAALRTATVSSISNHCILSNIAKITSNDSRVSF